MNKLGAACAVIAGLFAGQQSAAAEQVFHFIQADLDIARVDNKVNFTWEGDAWVGGDFNKGWFKVEGESLGGAIEEAEFQALYSRYFTRFFDLQAGIRHDIRPNEFGQTTYAVIGIQGLAPYWFETDTAFFFSEHGDISFRAELEYEILLTQRLIATPYFEANLSLSQNFAQGIGRGLSEIDTGLRIRYEIKREVAPYIDFNYLGLFGTARTLAVASGEKTKDFVIRGGIRLMF